MKLKAAPLSQTRCPYCHDGIGKEGAVCAECNATSHKACWDELKSCATCRGEKQKPDTSLYSVPFIPKRNWLDNIATKGYKESILELLTESPDERWKTCPWTWPDIWQEFKWGRVGKVKDIYSLKRYCHCGDEPTFGPHKNHK